MKQPPEKRMSALQELMSFVKEAEVPPKIVERAPPASKGDLLNVNPEAMLYRRPFIYSEPEHTVYFGEPGWYHSDLYDYNVVPNDSAGHFYGAETRHPDETQVEFYGKEQPRPSVLQAISEHTGLPIGKTWGDDWTAKTADSWDTREFAWPMEGEKPIQHQDEKDCTCDEGHKLDCPVHGMYAENDDERPLRWSLPEASPVGFPQDQPRAWQTPYTSKSASSLSDLGLGWLFSARTKPVDQDADDKKDFHAFSIHGHQPKVKSAARQWDAWEPGHVGKFAIEKDGKALAWKIYSDGWPHHHDMVDPANLASVGLIAHSGALDPYDKLLPADEQKVLALHPALTPVFGDRDQGWNFEAARFPHAAQQNLYDEWVWQDKMDRKCPKCASPMQWRDSAALGPLHPNGAWECTNQRCWHMIPGDLNTQETPEHPDPWADSEPGALTFPEEWTAAQRGVPGEAAGDWVMAEKSFPSPHPVMYHSTDAKHRGNIEQHGLLTHWDPEIDDEPGVFMTPHPPSEAEAGYDPRRHDLWEVNTDGWNVKADPFANLNDEEPYLNHLGGSYYSPVDIPPERLRLHRPADSTWTAAINPQQQPLDWPWQIGAQVQGLLPGSQGTIRDIDEPGLRAYVQWDGPTLRGGWHDAMHLQPKIAMIPQGFGDMYHVSPRRNRESILQHGLRGAEQEVQEGSPWDHIKRDHVQPAGNYLFDDPEDAYDYVYHMHKGELPEHDDEHDEDRWEYPEMPEGYEDWDPERQMEYDDTVEPKERTDDPNGYDIYRIKAHGLPIMPDPETKLINQEGSPLRSPQYWDLGKIHDVQQGFDDTWEMKDEYGGEPKRYIAPMNIHPSRLQLAEHVPSWELTRPGAEARWEQEDERNYPQPWAQIPFTERPIPGHESKHSAMLSWRLCPNVRRN